jgi:hypothetical protein
MDRNVSLDLLSNYHAVGSRNEAIESSQRATLTERARLILKAQF